MIITTIMIKYYDPDKLEPRLHGPYIIVECRTNSTVVVQMDDNGNVYETFNIRKIVPYKGTMVSLYYDTENYFGKKKRRELEPHWAFKDNDDENYYVEYSHYETSRKRRKVNFW